MRHLLLAVLIVILAACSGGAAGGSPPGSADPSNGPGETPDFGAIEHPTGATDVVLRYEEGGGFMMAAWVATQAPIFTLYGDGTIIFRNPAALPPEPVGTVYLMGEYRTARLSEEQVQDLLAYAFGQGGLGVARLDYGNDMIADAGTAVFTINAGGVSKTVSVYALGLEMEGMADAPARKAFKTLADRLGNIDANGAFTTTEFEPEAYRGFLFDGQGGPDSKPWPWTGIAPADFVANPDPNAFTFPKRAMTPAEIEVLGIDHFEGGLQGLTLIGPDDGKVYMFSLRPVLPGEAP